MKICNAGRWPAAGKLSTTLKRETSSYPKIVRACVCIICSRFDFAGQRSAVQSR
jgi:hypothetical protein